MHGVGDSMEAESSGPVEETFKPQEGPSRDRHADKLSSMHAKLPVVAEQAASDSEEEDCACSSQGSTHGVTRATCHCSFCLLCSTPCDTAEVLCPTCLPFKSKYIT